MAQYYKLLGFLYVLTALLWAFLWIPFGIGYYGLPWQGRSFRILIQMWAWAHVAVGVALAGYGARHQWRCWPIAAAAVLSAMSMAAMYDWISRHVAAL